MSAVGTPAALAFDVDAPRVECAVKMSVSMPADFIIPFSQWLMVASLTGLWGLRMESAFSGELLPQVCSFSDLFS